MAKTAGIATISRCRACWLYQFSSVNRNSHFLLAFPDKFSYSTNRRLCSTVQSAAMEDTPSNVLDALGSLHVDLVESIHAAFSRYLLRNGEDASDLFAVTKANLIRDYAICEFSRRTATNNRVRKYLSRNLLVFIIDNKYRLRFKKLNKRLLSSNIRTVQAIQFESQDWDLFGPQVLPANLNVGYVVNESYTDLDVYLTCPSGYRNIAWATSLESVPATSTPPIGFEEPTTLNKPRVRPRIHQKKVSDDESTSV
jgi:hypothetical protein